MKIKASSVFYALIMGMLLVYSFSCQQGKPKAVAVLTTTEVTEIHQTTAVSGGCITDDGGTLVTARGVCWSTSKTPTISDSKTVDGTGSGSFSSNISGLEPSTTYHVRAYATNRKGTGYGSTTYSFKTLEVAIPTLTTTTVSEITQTTAVSGGNIRDDGSATVIVRGVCWSTNDTPTIDDNKTEDGNGTGAFISNITGLKTGTTYYVRAYAINSKGTSYSNTYSFKTLSIPTLTTKKITDITQTTAVSGGSITDDGVALVTARGVCWSSSKTPTISDSKTEDGTGSGSFISNITNLVPNKTYYVRAYATNSVGTGYGSVFTFFTYQTFTDSRDGNVYKAVTIGNQVWMAENLKYLSAVVGPATNSHTTPYYYVYGYDGTDVNAAKATANYSTYGVLYNWPAAMADCPAGWHLPSDAEWTQLTEYLGTAAGGKLKEPGTAHWRSPNLRANNIKEFTALPGGFRSYEGTFGNIGDYGYWWSASQGGGGGAWDRRMGYYDSDVYRYNCYKKVGFSVRCVRD